jgi:hypothetical protein
MSRNLPNWLEAYLAYTAESESPETFHLWVGLATIAGAVRRKAFFDMGYFLVFPNLYIVIVSPPGRCKKSTAMRIGRKLLGEVPGINFTTDSVSRERLIQDLSQSFVDGHSSMTAYSSEFASMLTTSGMDMVVFLTDIYDSPTEWSHKTKSGGTNKIKSPYLNLIGATTPDWLARAMPLDTIGIGLTSRVIFVYADTPRAAKPFPALSSAQRKLGELLLEDLIEIAGINGEYTFDEEARDAYEKWYLARFKNSDPQIDSRLSGYFERKPIHLLKTCMIVAAARHNDTVITMKDLQLAHELIDRAEETMPKVFSAVGKNPLNMDTEDALAQILVTPGGVSYGEILERLKHNVRKEEMDEILETLILIGKVQFKGGRYFAVI